MASFEGVLANIPGYGGYLAKGQLDRKNTLSDIQQLGGVQGLMAQMQQQQMAQGIRGVLSDTTIPEDQKIQRLAQFGEPGMKVAGTLAQMQKQQADLMRERDFRTGLAGLGENPTQEQLVGLASRFGSPDKVMSIHQGALDRKAQAESAREKGIADRQARLDGITMQLASREMEGEANRALRERLEAQSNDLRRELRAAGQGAGSKPPVGYRFTADGSLEAIPGGPADAKAQALAQRQADGANDVDVALGTLRDAYSRLEEGGGITSTNKSSGANAAASIASSGVGQAAGRLFGTKNQSARNDIAMSRPGLLAAVMKATGMSAKQMDSNAELKLWLSTATDPTLDVESNRKALDNIERKYMRPGARLMPPPGNTGGATESFGAPSGKVMQIKGDAEYNMLPKGARYAGPDGVERVK